MVYIWGIGPYRRGLILVVERDLAFREDLVDDGITGDIALVFGSMRTLTFLRRFSDIWAHYSAIYVQLECRLRWDLALMRISTGYFHRVHVRCWSGG